MDFPIVLEERGNVRVVRIGSNNERSEIRCAGLRQTVDRCRRRVHRGCDRTTGSLRSVRCDLVERLSDRGRIELLNLAAGVERVIAANKSERVAELEATLLRCCGTRNDAPVLQARETAASGRHRQRLVDEVAETEAETVDVHRRDDARVAANECVLLRLDCRCEAEPMDERACFVPLSR